MYFLSTYRINGREAYSLKLRCIECGKRRHFVFASRVYQPADRSLSQWGTHNFSSAEHYCGFPAQINKRKKTTDDKKKKSYECKNNFTCRQLQLYYMHALVWKLFYATGYSHNFMPRISDNWNHFDCESFSWRMSGERWVDTSGWWAV